MGSRGSYWKTARFASFTEGDLLWKTVGEIDGVKIIRRPDKPNGSLPEFAKTSEAYIGVSSEGDLDSLRVYEKGFPVCEFNLGHYWHHGLPEGAVHVHSFTKGTDGNPVRSQEGKTPTAEQWEKWGGIIMKMKERNRK